MKGIHVLTCAVAAALLGVLAQASFAQTNDHQATVQPSIPVPSVSLPWSPQNKTSGAHPSGSALGSANGSSARRNGVVSGAVIAPPSSSVKIGAPIPASARAASAFGSMNGTTAIRAIDPPKNSIALPNGK